MKTMYAALTALAMLLTPAMASAQVEFYAESGGWTIFKGPRSCHMIASYEGDALLTVYVEDAEKAVFWLQNPSWKSIRDDAEYELQIEFDDYGAWDMPASGKSDEDGPGIAWVGNIASDRNDNTFMGEFMVAEGMTVSINGRRIGSYSMKDTRSAALTLSTCLRIAHQTSDPFEGLEGVPTDPFRGI
jgi:hypothetical protein